MLPLFMILAAGALFVGYICWQGLKVQQAANLAARIQGQERVGGGRSQQSIAQDNGLDSGGDTVPDDSSMSGLAQDPNALDRFKSAPNGGVYGKFYQAVHEMFGPGEQQKLFVPPPEKEGINSDRIRVIRVLNPPKIFDYQMKPIKLEATAYGGEDTHMYGLPRWGKTANSQGQFYTGALENPNND